MSSSALQARRRSSREIFIGFSFSGPGHHARNHQPDKGEALLADCGAEGLEIEVRRLDVCDPESISTALADADELDVLINNAGFEVQGALDMIDDDLKRRQLETNMLGPLRTIRAVLPAWRKRGNGAIVNISSVAGRAASPWGGAYSASKFALEGMSEALHFDVAGTGIRVHLIEPGRFPPISPTTSSARRSGTARRTRRVRSRSVRR